MTHITFSDGTKIEAESMAPDEHGIIEVREATITMAGQRYRATNVKITLGEKAQPQPDETPKGTTALHAEMKFDLSTLTRMAEGL